jgi:hypothetical protein
VLDFMRELQEKFINERQDIEQKLISKRLEDTLNEGIFFDEVKFKKMLSSMPFSVSIGSHKIFSSNTAPSSGSISIDYLFSRASQYT